MDLLQHDSVIKNKNTSQLLYYSILVFIYGVIILRYWIERNTAIVTWTKNTVFLISKNVYKNEKNKNKKPWVLALGIEMYIPLLNCRVELFWPRKEK